MGITTSYRAITTAAAPVVGAALGFYLAVAQIVPIADTLLRTANAPVPVIWGSAVFWAALTPILTGIAGACVVRTLTRPNTNPANSSGQPQASELPTRTVSAAA